MALMGLGYQSVLQVKTDEYARMDLNDLHAKLEQCKANGEQVMAIVATAGTTDAGAIDPLRKIAELAKAQQIWVHVDAAWGGALLLSEKHRDYLDGIELVDSVTLDFHKQYFQMRRPDIKNCAGRWAGPSRQPPQPKRARGLMHKLKWR
jgi:L-2,4-diaminobutyrate decarboxylase